MARRLVVSLVVLGLAAVTISPVAAFADNRGSVPYFGGPVMHQETTYALFWDPGGSFTSATKDLLTQYLADVAHDSGQDTNTFSVLEQYTDSTGKAAYAQTFSGALSDSDAYPSKSASCQLADITWPPGTPCILDSQIQTELSSYIAAHSLPTGMSTIYVVFTPSNVEVCQTGCAPGVWCGYHGHIGGASGVVYAVIPFTDPPPGAVFPYLKECGLHGGGTQPQEPNGSVADLAINVVSHELAESITNPLNGISFVNSDDPAWQGSSQGEVADRCDVAGDPNLLQHDPNAFLPVLGGDAGSGTEYTELINGHPYYTQSVWSNATESCLMRTGAPGAVGGPGPGGGGGTGGTGGLAPGTSVSRATAAHIKVAGKLASVQLHCAGSTGQTCRLTLTLTSKVRRKVVTVGKAGVTLQAGQTKTVKLRLNRVGKHLLSAHHRLKVSLTIKKSGGGTARPVLSRTLRFTTAKKKQQHAGQRG